MKIYLQNISIYTEINPNQPSPEINTPWSLEQLILTKKGHIYYEQNVQNLRKETKQTMWMNQNGTIPISISSIVSSGNQIYPI